MGRAKTFRAWWKVMVLAMVLSSSSACLTDFERFRDAVPNNEEDIVDEPDADEPDAPEEDVDEPDMDEPDMDEPDMDEPDALEDIDEPDMDEPDMDEPDMNEPDMDEPDVPEEPQLGGVCEQDSDCPEGLTCLEEADGGLCTVACQVDADCPEATVCAAERGLPYCLQTCAPDNPCEREGFGPNGLNCWPWFEDTSVCISDNDVDFVLNQVDNCLGVNNTDQIDLDRDGEGDACDDNPRCPATPVVDEPLELIDRAAPPRPLRGGGWLVVPSLDHALYVGGLGDDGEPVSQIDGYDLGQRVWNEGVLPSLPYAAHDLDVTHDTLRRELVATPGQSTPGVPTDRLLILNLEGTPGWRFGPTLPTTLTGARISYTFPHYITIVGYAPGNGEERLLQAYLYDRQDGSITQMVQDEIFNLEEIEQGTLTINAQSDGRVYVLNPEQRDRIYVVDPSAQTFNLLVNTANDLPRLEFDLFFGLDPNVAAPPIISMPSAFPLIHFARMDTGEVAKIFVDAGQPQNSEYELLLPIETDQPGASVQAVFLDGPASLLTLVTPAAAEDQVEPVESQLIEHNLGCFSSLVLTVFDLDRDTHPDLLDNCPRDRNPTQVDLDGDAQGDECDLDTDGDEIPNAEDAIFDGEQVVTDLSLDTDNDGVINDDDEDDDGDRIADEDDRYPLDTDNDRLPNRVDPDDDGDLFDDQQERDAGSAPQDVLSIPGGQRTAFVWDDGQNRALVVMTLSELGDGVTPSPLALPAGAVPSDPRLVADAPLVVYGDYSELIPTLGVFDMSGEAEPQVVQVPGLEPGSFDVRGGQVQLEVLYVRNTVNEAQEQIQVFEMGPLGQAELLFDVPGERLSGVDIADDLDALVFGSYPRGCVICQDLSTYALPGGPVQSRSDLDLGVAERAPRLSDDGQQILFLASPEGISRVYISEGEQPPVAVSPQDMHVGSADFAPNARRVLYSARPAGDPQAPYRLYLLDRALERTWELSPEEGQVLEVTFGR